MIYKYDFSADVNYGIDEMNFSINIGCENSIDESVSKEINAPGAGTGKINFLYNGLETTKHPLRVKVVGFKAAGGKDIEIPINPITKEIKVPNKLKPGDKRKAVENMVYTAAGIGLELFEDIRDYYGYKDKTGVHPADVSKEENIRKKINEIANKKNLDEYLKKGKSVVKWVNK